MLSRKPAYRISSFKRRGFNLILRPLGAAFIRGRHLFQKSKQKKMKSRANSKNKIFLKLSDVKP